jgi:energy-coupling factor transporter transmembrane protein EcfT
VRPRDRALSRVGAIGMIATGLCLGALTLLDQTGATGVMDQALAVIAAFTGLVSAFASWSIWRAADELQQRAILIAHASALTLLTTSAFIWAIAGSLGWPVKLMPYDVLLTMIIAQSVTAIVSGYATQFGAAPAANARSRPA